MRMGYLLTMQENKKASLRTRVAAAVAKNYDSKHSIKLQIQMMCHAIERQEQNFFFTPKDKEIIEIHVKMAI